MPRKRAVPEQPAEFQMKTRSRTKIVTPEPSNSSGEDSSLSSLTSAPSTPPQMTQGRKRKLPDSSSDEVQILPKAKRSAQNPSIPAALQVPVGSRNLKGSRPASVGAAIISKTINAFPQGQVSLTPPDSTHSSRRGSRVIRSETVEALPETIPPPANASASSTPESSTSLRRSSRIIKPEVLEVAPKTNRPSTNLQSSSPNQAEAAQSRKRKFGESSSEDTNAPKRKRTLQTVKQLAKKPNITFQEYKEKELWPDHDAKNPIYYANDGTTRYRPGETGDTPESRSPKKPSRGGARAARGGTHANGAGRGKGKSKGRAGRGGESPEPPNRRHPLTQDEKVLISMLKARQQELKRFFTTVGAQQVEILEQMASRDLNRITKKPNAHKKVPEYETIIDELQTGAEDAKELARKRYDVQFEAEMQRLEQEKEVIEQKFKVSPFISPHKVQPNSHIDSHRRSPQRTPRGRRR